MPAGLLDREQSVPMLADPDMQSTIQQVIQSLNLKGGQRFAEQTGQPFCPQDCIPSLAQEESVSDANAAASDRWHMLAYLFPTFVMHSSALALMLPFKILDSVRSGSMIRLCTAARQPMSGAGSCSAAQLQRGRQAAPAPRESAYVCLQGRPLVYCFQG